MIIALMSLIIKLHQSGIQDIVNIVSSVFSSEAAGELFFNFEKEKLPYIYEGLGGLVLTLRKLFAQHYSV